MSHDAVQEPLTWEPGPLAPQLAPGEVHVWRLALDQPKALSRELRAWLSAEECQRADRFHRPRDGIRFVVGRAALRDLLGRYTGEVPANLSFDTGPFGKPTLGKPAGTNIHFNVSHSHGLAVIALSQGRELGIDLELMRPMDSMDAIAHRFFAAIEYAAYQEQPEEDRALAFFRVWTRKEAYLKATGTGISVPLDSFHVSVKPDEPAALLHVEGKPNEVDRWSLREFRAGAETMGTLAVEGQDWSPVGWSYHLWGQDKQESGC